MSKQGVFSCPHFSVFGLNTGKSGPEKTPYLDTFHEVYKLRIWKKDLRVMGVARIPTNTQDGEVYKNS